MRRFFLLSITLLLHVSSTTWAATVNLDTGSGTIPYPGSTDISSPLFTNSCVTAKLGFTGVVNTIYFFRFELFNATFVKTPIKSNFLLNTSSLTLGEPYVPQVSSVTGDDRIIVSATVGSSNVNPDSSFTLCFPSGLYMQSGSKAVELKYSAYAGQSDAHYEANVFAEAKATLAYIEIFSVTLDTKGIGSVSGAGKFKEGETVNLTATPAPWHILTSWSPSPCAASFEMPRNDLTCTATFMPEEFTLTLNKIGRGVFSGGGNSFIFGDPVNLKAAPAYGYTFSGWEPEPCASSFSMPGSDLTCTAIPLMAGVLPLVPIPL